MSICVQLLCGCEEHRAMSLLLASREGIKCEYSIEYMNMYFDVLVRIWAGPYITCVHVYFELCRF